MNPRTLYEKLLDTHTIRKYDEDGNERLLFIDRTVVNEYTSPQAFTLLRENKLKVRRPSATLGTIDHVNPSAADRPIYPTEENARKQVQYLEENGQTFGLEVYNNDSPDQGIEHVVMVEQGRVQPGMVIGAGDSHTAMYGAFGCLGFGIGTSDIYHYLATSALNYKRLKNMRVHLVGKKPSDVSAKDLIIHVVRELGAGGCGGCCVEFTGEAVRELSPEGRLTFCNMAVECGARSSLIAPDEEIFEYLRGRPYAPKGENWDKAVEYWRTLKSDEGAVFDKEAVIDVSGAKPMVTWGTSPDQAVSIDEVIPDPMLEQNPDRRADMQRALSYMGLKAGEKIAGIPITHAFIGSCTNSRIEDLRAAASVLKGRKVHPGVTAAVVPGSMQIRKQAEEEGLDQIFKDAGWQWRKSGCSLCLAMNGDILQANDRCVSATNRNFEGRQGVGTRTHLASPQIVASSSINGCIADFRS